MVTPIHDCDLQKAVLLEWRKARPAAVLNVVETGERHFWHALASTSTAESASISAAWAGVVYFHPDGAVSNTLKVEPQVYTHPSYRF
jgi:hypothetical protein